MARKAKTATAIPQSVDTTPQEKTAPVAGNVAIALCIADMFARLNAQTRE